MVQDMTQIIYQAFLDNTIIEKTVLNGEKHSIYYYEMPDGTLPNTMIIIRPMRPPQTQVAASDESINKSLLYQIDVQASERMIPKEIQYEVERVMHSLGFFRLNSDELDEYFPDTKRYVDARRFIKPTNLYDTSY
ncbi:MAG TPA: hypothetical protein K8V00_03150 [Ligilactobacillus acidipiscis]|uniref:Phage protein n=1 Tax=Ligilactobacillus acidipiscis TaxID=89059 RepID=A0A921K125_9LACO|nr:hypothetical protein [Ligilactobacillus acidipiscis]